MPQETFQLYSEYESPASAAKLLDAWCKWTMRSHAEPAKGFAYTVRRHRELLLKYR
jgi:transposase